MSETLKLRTPTYIELVMALVLTGCGPVPPKQEDLVPPELVPAGSDSHQDRCGHNGVLMLCGEGA